MKNPSTFLLDSLCFASLAVYRPGRPRPEDTDLTLNVRKLTYDVKEGLRLRKAAEYVARMVRSGEFLDFLGDDVTMVPAPGSAPRHADSVWPSGMLATALSGHVFLGTRHILLERTTAVQKAAFAESLAERPTAQTHFDTVVLRRGFPLFDSNRITVVDDVVTTGATLLGCASRLKHEFPNADVKGFALMRSLSRKIGDGSRQIEKVIDPVYNGSIILNPDGTTQRTP